MATRSLFTLLLLLISISFHTADFLKKKKKKKLIIINSPPSLAALGCAELNLKRMKIMFLQCVSRYYVNNSNGIKMVLLLLPGKGEQEHHDT